MKSCLNEEPSQIQRKFTERNLLESLKNISLKQVVDVLKKEIITSNDPFKTDSFAEKD